VKDDDFPYRRGRDFRTPLDERTQMQVADRATAETPEL
jgi:hypothetical protein